MTTTANKVTLTPIGTRVVLQRTESEEQSASGIILPESAQKKPETAKVIAVGDVKAVKVGHTVLLDKYSGQEVEINDEKFVIVKEEDIIAIVEE